ncbi:hypothetical protein V7S43_009211, partial [Phytophthora oleae]
MAQTRKQPPPDLEDEFSDLDLIDEESDVEPTQVSPPPNSAVSCSAALAVVPSILGKTFDSWGAFFQFWEQFEHQNLVVYRTRDCQTTKLYNRKRVNRPELQVPSQFGYAFRKYACTLGCQQKSRSTGKRAKRMERYRNSKAMFRAAVVRSGELDAEGKSVWTI